MNSQARSILVLMIFICNTQFCFSKQIEKKSPGNTIPNTVKDVEGHVYHTLVIGKQVWLQENLRTRKYRNGKPIAKNLTNAQWSANKTGACAVYANDSIKENAFGLLYNWYAVANPAGLCPTGWHVPKDAEWTVLTTYLGGVSVAGGKMKAISSLWAAG